MKQGQESRRKAYMPSPFPGMDPYLEGPEFGGFHGPPIVEMARQLTVLLRPRYVARMQKWFCVDSAVGEEYLFPRAKRKTGDTHSDVAIVKESASRTRAVRPSLEWNALENGVILNAAAAPPPACRSAHPYCKNAAMPAAFLPALRSPCFAACVMQSRSDRDCVSPT